MGNTREQLFHAWRSFTFDKNTETIDAYVTCIRQVTALLGYGEPQILEVFKNTLPTKLLSHSASGCVTRVGLTQRKDRDKTFKVL